MGAHPCDDVERVGEHPLGHRTAPAQLPSQVTARAGEPSGVEDGLIVEKWICSDTASLFRQIT